MGLHIPVAFLADRYFNKQIIECGFLQSMVEFLLGFLRLTMLLRERERERERYIYVYIHIYLDSPVENAPVEIEVIASLQVSTRILHWAHPKEALQFPSLGQSNSGAVFGCGCPYNPGFRV